MKLLIILTTFIFSSLYAGQVAVETNHPNGFNKSTDWSILVNKKSIKLTPINKSSNSPSKRLDGSFDDNLLTIGNNTFFFESIVNSCNKSKFTKRTIIVNGNRLKTQGSECKQLNKINFQHYYSLKEIDKKLYDDIEFYKKEIEKRNKEYLEDIKRSEYLYEEKSRTLSSLEALYNELAELSFKEISTQKKEEIDFLNDVIFALENEIIKIEEKLERQDKFNKKNIEETTKRLQERVKKIGGSEINFEALEKQVKNDEKDVELNNTLDLKKLVDNYINKLLTHQKDNQMSKFVELSLEAINHFKTISKILGEESEDLNPFHLSYDTEYERLNSFIFTYLDKDFWPKNTQVPKETRNYIDNEIKQFNPELAQQIKSEMANWGRVLTDDERKSLAAYRAVGSLIKNFFSQVKDVVQEIVEIKNKTDIILSEAILAAKHGLCEAGSLALNDYRDFYELVEGKDYCSGKELTLFERTVSSFGLLLGQGKWWREGFAAIGAIAVGKKTNALVNSARKLGVRTSEGIKDFADLSKRIVGNDIGAVGDLSKIIKGKMTRFNPIKRGPLSDIPIGSGKTVADTFRSSSYFETLTEAPVKLYRVHGDGASPMSKYWSRTKPTGPVQAVLDSALDPDWGNTAKKWVEITVPKGTKIYEGIVSEVALKRGSRQVSTGQLLGGGSQVYINKKAIPDSWITNRGDF